MRPSCITASGFARAVKQLERDQPLEPRVPRAIDGAVRSAADDVEQIEVAPARAIGHQVRRRVGADRQQLMQLAMPGGDLRDHRELVGDRALLVGRQREVIDAQSTCSPSAMRPAASRRASSATAHLLGQPHQRAAHGHARRVGAGFAHQLGDLGVRAAHLDARDHRLARLRVEPLERAVVLGERLGADRGFERRLALSAGWSESSGPSAGVRRWRRISSRMRFMTAPRR